MYKDVRIMDYSYHSYSISMCRAMKGLSLQQLSVLGEVRQLSHRDLETKQNRCPEDGKRMEVLPVGFYSRKKLFLVEQRAAGRGSSFETLKILRGTREFANTSQDKLQQRIRLTWN